MQLKTSLINISKACQFPDLHPWHRRPGPIELLLKSRINHTNAEWEIDFCKYDTVATATSGNNWMNAHRVKVSIIFSNKAFISAAWFAFFSQGQSHDWSLYKNFVLSTGTWRHLKKTATVFPTSLKYRFHRWEHCVECHWPGVRMQYSIVLKLHRREKSLTVDWVILTKQIQKH